MRRPVKISPVSQLLSHKSQFFCAFPPLRGGNCKKVFEPGNTKSNWESYVKYKSDLSDRQKYKLYKTEQNRQTIHKGAGGKGVMHNGDKETGGGERCPSFR